MGYEDYAHGCLTGEEYEEIIVNPLKELFYEAVTRYYGEMFELGYAGYPGSSQSLNIDNPYDRVADETARYALDLLRREGLGISPIRPAI